MTNDIIMRRVALLDALGKSAYESGRFRDAALYALEMRSLGEQSSGTAFNAAQCLHIIGRTPEAVSIMEELCDSFPDSSEYAFYLAVCCATLGDFERSYKLVENIPDTSSAIISHCSYHFLRKGDHKTGHEIMQSAERFTPLEKKFPTLDFNKRYKKGTPLSGKRLLLIEENGLGDAILAARFIEQYVRRGARVVLGTHKLLVPLLSRLPYPPEEFGDATKLIEKGEYDYYLPDSTSEHMIVLDDYNPVGDKTVPYIRSNPEFVKKWEPFITLHDQKRKKIGIHWHATRMCPEMVYARDIPLEMLQRFCKIGTLFSFQRDGGGDELRLYPEIVDIGSRFSTLEDSAAALEQMDYLVTGCAFIANLAGAMRKRTALLASVDPHYVWIGRGEYSDWYPSVRIFRQTSFSAWEAPVASAFRWIENNGV